MALCQNMVKHNIIKIWLYDIIWFKMIVLLDLLENCCSDNSDLFTAVICWKIAHRNLVPFLFSLPIVWKTTKMSVHTRKELGARNGEKEWETLSSEHMSYQKSSWT